MFSLLRRNCDLCGCIPLLWFLRTGYCVQTFVSLLSHDAYLVFTLSGCNVAHIHLLSFRHVTINSGWAEKRAEIWVVLLGRPPRTVQGDPQLRLQVVATYCPRIYTCVPRHGDGCFSKHSSTVSYPASRSQSNWAGDWVQGWLRRIALTWTVFIKQVFILCLYLKKISIWDLAVM